MPDIVCTGLINHKFSITILLMDKTITVIKQNDSRNTGYVFGTKEERISMVWPLTCEVVSLSKNYNVEQPLQRHIVNIVRKKS